MASTIHLAATFATELTISPWRDCQVVFEWRANVSTAAAHADSSVV